MIFSDIVDFLCMGRKRLSEQWPRYLDAIPICAVGLRIEGRFMGIEDDLNRMFVEEISGDESLGILRILSNPLALSTLGIEAEERTYVGASRFGDLVAEHLERQGEEGWYPSHRSATDLYGFPLSSAKVIVGGGAWSDFIFEAIDEIGLSKDWGEARKVLGGKRSDLRTTYLKGAQPSRENLEEDLREFWKNLLEPRQESSTARGGRRSKTKEP